MGNFVSIDWKTKLCGRTFAFFAVDDMYRLYTGHEEGGLYLGQFASFQLMNEYIIDLIKKQEEEENA